MFPAWPRGRTGRNQDRPRPTEGPTRSPGCGGCGDGSGGELGPQIAGFPLDSRSLLFARSSCLTPDHLRSGISVRLRPFLPGMSVRPASPAPCLCYIPPNHNEQNRYKHSSLACRFCLRLSGVQRGPNQWRQTHGGQPVPTYTRSHSPKAPSRSFPRSPQVLLPVFLEPLSSDRQPAVLPSCVREAVHSWEVLITHPQHTHPPPPIQ